MTTYRLFPATNGPAAAVTYTGSFIAGVVFAVKGGGNWLNGYWQWVAASGGSTAAVKCALWSPVKVGNAQLVPGSVVTSGALTAGQWNFIPLAAPIQLAPGYDSNSSVNGSAYIAAIGVNANFNDTFSQFNTGDTYAAGITNGPLVAYSGITGSKVAPYSLAQGVFTTTGSDPAVNCPLTADTSGDGASNFWVDVQVSDTAPGGYGGTYRLWPSKADANASTTGDLNVNYTVATEIHLTQSCTLNNVWYFVPNTATTTATRCDVWDIGGGTSVASIASPSWLTASGSAYTGPAANTLGTWVKAAFAGGATLAAGSYRVSVYNANGTTDANWNPKDATTDYWAQTNPGAGSGGITQGPLFAPDQPHASNGLNWTAGNAGATPPHTDGTVLKAQPVFYQPATDNGAVGFPQLNAPVGGGTNQTQNYWVDLEATPLAANAPAGVATVSAAAPAGGPAAAVAMTAAAILARAPAPGVTGFSNITATPAAAAVRAVAAPVPAGLDEGKLTAKDAAASALTVRTFP